MSEYQYYEFLAVDRPLNADQLGEVRALSTRAEITSTSFVNVYHFGSFRGDPRRMMERYYDAFLYTANWGTYRLMFRLPSTLLDLKTAEQYCYTDAANVWSHGDSVILDLHRGYDDVEDYWDDEGGQGRLAAIIPARAQLAAGDLRMLYLGWLLSVDNDELDDDDTEPPVPPNLAALDGPLRSLVEFLHLDDDLLAAAAEASPTLPMARPSDADLTAWVAALPASEKDELLLRVLGNDAVHLRTELLRRLHQPDAILRPSGSSRTVGQLREAAQARAEQERLRREQAVAEARRRELDILEQQGERAWRRVASLIESKQVREYAVAVDLLSDLRDLSERQHRTDEFARRVRELRHQYARRPALIERLNRAGL